jgi:hypothetical protein
MGQGLLVDSWRDSRLLESALVEVTTLDEAMPGEEGQESSAVRLELVKERDSPWAAEEGESYPLGYYCSILTTYP